MKINIKGYEVLIDDEDYHLIKLGSWKINKKKSGACYVALNYSLNNITKIKQLHREVLGINNPKIQVDHINCNGLDNRKSNLRIVTNEQNSYNRGMTSNNKSGYKGVCWHKGMKKWVAQITYKKEKMYLGAFICPTSAWLAYVRAAIKYHGEFARFA